MKVLIISDAWHPQVNGVVRTYEYLCEELEKMGHETKVIGPNDFSLRFPTPGYAEIHLVLFPYQRLKKMIEAFSPDAIHLATEGPLGFAGRKYCLKHKKVFTTSYHSHFPDYIAKRIAKYLPFMYKAIFETTKGIIRNFHAPARAMLIATDSLKKELNEWGFKTSKYPLTRGVKLDLYYPAKDGKKPLFNELQRPVALYVGRVAIEKNLEDFLSMDWEGSKIIVGDGPSLTSLKAKYPNVHFVGKKTGEELAAHYRSADVFVFPSRTDTFGIVLIEALASGVPVAAYNVTGPKDIITEPFLGCLEETDLSKAARNALKAGSAKQRTEYIHQHYSWSYAAEQFETALKLKFKKKTAA